MHLLQSFLGAVLFAAQVTTLISCSDASFNVTQTVTTITTITPVVTMSCLDLKLTTILHASNQISKTSSLLNNGMSLIPSPTFTERPLLNPTERLMAAAAAAASFPSLSVCDFAIGNFGFNTTNLCSSTPVTSIVPSNTLMPANDSTILSTTNLPTLPPSPTDTGESTSTTVVVVSLVTTSGGGTGTVTITSGSTGTASSSITTASGTNTATSTSAACLRAQPIQLLIWRNWMIAKARDQVLNAFRGWANAERAKSFLGIAGTWPDAVTTENIVTTADVPKTATNKSAAAALLSASSLLGLAVVILFFY